MPTATEILTQLKKLGSEQTRKTFMRHGAPAENLFGVKVGDLKTIAKKIKGEQQLACDLYDTGNLDAMYLAGIVADGSKMKKAQLDKWANQATWHMISEYTVPGVATESPFTHELALKWIKSKKGLIGACGWCTYGGLIATRPDADLDLVEIKSLLNQISTDINKTDDRVRYTMNGFVIGVGAYIKPLLKDAKAIAKKIGKVEVNMGDTACKVPFAPDYIAKIEKMGRIGQKRKTIKC